MPKFWKVYQPFLCDCHWRCPDSCQDRAHTTCPFWIPVPCVGWTHSRSTTAMFGTIDHAALAILVRGQRVPCKCRPQLRVKQLPTKLGALARLEKHEEKKKRKENLSSAHLTSSSKQIHDGKTPPPQQSPKLPFPGATLYQAHRWAEDLRFPAMDCLDLFTPKG